jgi:site-specific DNA recombinase
MSVKDRDHCRIRVMCSQAKEAGTCTNKRPYYLDEIEKTVLSGLKRELRNPEAIKLYVQSYNDEMKRLSAASSSTLHKLENRLLKVEGELSRAIDAVVRGIVEPEDVRERIAGLKQEKQKIEIDLERFQSSKTPVVLHPTAMASYFRCVDDLEQSIKINSLHGSEESKSALRELVDSVVVSPPDKAADRMTVEGAGLPLPACRRQFVPAAFFSGGKDGSGGGTRTPDTRIMIPLL